MELLTKELVIILLIIIKCIEKDRKSTETIKQVP